MNVTLTRVSGTEPPFECFLILFISITDLGLDSRGGVNGLAVTYDGVDTVEVMVEQFTLSTSSSFAQQGGLPSRKKSL